MRLTLGLRLSNNAGAVSVSGPTITAAGSIDVSTFKIGTTQTITAGTATASGGGTVTYEVRHLSDGEVKSTLAAYAHVAADDTEAGVAQWRAVEAGGTNPGATSWQSVASGTITYPAPTASGALSDQSFSEDSGIQTYDASGDFTGSALVYSLTTAPAGVTINSSTGVIDFDTDVLNIQTGTSIVVTATNSGGSVNSGFSLDITAAATAPDAFVDANWSVATGSGASELDITLTTLPANNGASITNVQYDIDASGTWINLPAYAGTGTYTITAAAASTSYAIRLRAVNSAGNGAAGNSESATSGSGAATAPSAFVDSDWSVAAGSDHKDLNITIATLPNNGGSAITDIEYDVDASGTWVSLGTATTGTTTVTMAAGNTSYAIRLRAVNAVGNAAAGNSESATSAALTITGYSFNGTDTISFSLNGTGTLWTSTTAATETDAADIENGVAAFDTDSDAISSGVNNVTVSYPNTFDDNWLNLVAKNGSEYSNVISNQYTFADIVPRAFADANWSVATGSGANELDITIVSLPSNGGATITDVEYDVDASGTWISLGATSGTITVSMAAASTSYAIRLRGVNSVGNGLAGNSESATSGASGGATTPVAITLDGSTDYLENNADFVNDADSNKFTLYMKMGASGSRSQVLHNGLGYFDVETNFNFLTVIGKDTGGTTILDFDTAFNDPDPDDSTTREWMISYDGSVPSIDLWVDGVQKTGSSNTLSGGTIDFTRGNWALGAQVNTGDKFSGSITRIALFRDVALDLSVAGNRTSLADPDDTASVGGTLMIDAYTETTITAFDNQVDTFSNRNGNF